MPHWLVTSTFYGQGLPGDERGSVTNVRDHRPADANVPVRIEHACPGENYEDAIPGLHREALEQLNRAPGGAMGDRAGLSSICRRRFIICVIASQGRW